RPSPYGLTSYSPDEKFKEKTQRGSSSSAPRREPAPAVSPGMVGHQPDASARDLLARARRAGVRVSHAAYNRAAAGKQPFLSARFGAERNGPLRLYLLSSMEVRKNWRVRAAPVWRRRRISI